MNIKYLKNYIDLNDDDITDIDFEDELQDNSDIFKNNVLKQLGVKEVERWLKCITGELTEKDGIFSDLFVKKMQTSYGDFDMSLNLGKNHHKKFPLFVYSTFYTPFYRKQDSEQLLVFLKSMCEQLMEVFLNNNSNNTIHYDYYIPGDYANYFLHLIDNLNEDGDNFFETVTNSKFLYNVSERILECLLKHNFIDKKSKSDILSKINCDNSRVVFHFTLSKQMSRQFFNLDAHLIENDYWGGENTCLKPFLEGLKEKIQYFDFSDFNIKTEKGLLDGDTYDGICIRMKPRIYCNKTQKRICSFLKNYTQILLFIANTNQDNTLSKFNVIINWEVLIQDKPHIKIANKYKSVLENAIMDNCPDVKNVTTIIREIH